VFLLADGCFPSLSKCAVDDDCPRDQCVGDAHRDFPDRTEEGANDGGPGATQITSAHSIRPPKALSLGAGRNDGIIRLYTADPRGGVKEYTYSGGWNRTASVTANAAAGVAIGPGRNDGVNRIYVTEDSSVYEYTYAGR